MRVEGGVLHSRDAFVMPLCICMEAFRHFYGFLVGPAQRGLTFAKNGGVRSYVSADAFLSK